MLNDEQKEAVVKEILPILASWKINDALDALEYAKGCICDFSTVTLPPFQAEQGNH
jgi:hypothetical protein